MLPFASTRYCCIAAFQLTPTPHPAPNTTPNKAVTLIPPNPPLHRPLQQAIPGTNSA